eukprot:4698769-Prymnesium_polylepis.1
MATMYGMFSSILNAHGPAYPRFQFPHSSFHDALSLARVRVPDPPAASARVSQLAPPPQRRPEPWFAFGYKTTANTTQRH